MVAASAPPNEPPDDELVDAYELIWAVYEKHRISLFNKLYFQARLDLVTRANFWMEVAIAISASSVVAGWAMFKSWPGTYVWAAFAGVSAIAAILKPFLDLPKRIKTYAGFVSGYAQAYAALGDEVEEIRIRRGPNRQTLTALKTHRTLLNSLAVQEFERDRDKLKRSCQQLVLKTHPNEAYWTFTTPGELENGNRQLRP